MMGKASGPLDRALRDAVHACTRPVKWAYTAGLLSAKDLVLPDFLGIGAQKAGTTWLARNLRCHPDLFLPGRKELHYFDRAYHRSLKAYSKLFLPGRDRVRGEITPAYAVIPRDRIRFIRSVMPEVRLIFLVRDPVERAWSHALMRLVKRAGRRYEEVPEAEFFRLFRFQGCVSRSDYAAALENWLSVFPEEQLFVGFFEDLKERPRELLTDVFRHLGVRDDIEWDRLPYNQVIHAGVRIPIPDRYREYLLEQYAPQIERLAARYGDRVARWGRPAPADALTAR